MYNAWGGFVKIDFESKEPTRKSCLLYYTYAGEGPLDACTHPSVFESIFVEEESKIACRLFVQILNVRRGLPAPVCSSHDKQRVPRPRELKLFSTAFF